MGSDSAGELLNTICCSKLGSAPARASASVAAWGGALALAEGASEAKATVVGEAAVLRAAGSDALRSEGDALRSEDDACGCEWAASF